MAACVLVIGGLVTPTFTVKITDRINRIDSGGYIVANVPAGLAVFASLTSTAGDLLTREFETNFSDVDAPTLHDNGFLFGMRLLTETTRLEISDDLFAASMSSYVRNCLFYDILLGLKSVSGLRDAADSWAYMTNEPAEARMFVVKTAVKSGGWTSEIKTCKAGIADLNMRWNSEINIAARRLAKRVSPASDNIADAPLQALIRTELSTMHDFLIGASRNATQILQRQMTINAILNEPESWLGETGDSAALESYINARLDLQTEQSYRAIARQAEKWVPNLKAVFQCIYYGIFPFAVLLMLSPMGSTVIKNYIFGLVWIESWGPLYAIINYIVNSQASARMQATVTALDGNVSDITIASQAGIQAVEADISVMAGYLSMSIPFLAIALASGAGRFAALATSTLAVSQEAVADTTRESATGNLSIGNTSHDSHQYHNRSGFQWGDSAWVNTGSSAAVDASTGAHINAFGGVYGGDAARNTINAAPASSNLLTSINFGDRLANSLTDSAGASYVAADNYNNQYNESIGAARNLTSSFANQIVNSERYGAAFSMSEDARTTDEYRVLREAAERLSDTTGATNEQSLQALASAHFGLNFKGILGGQVKGHFDQTTSNKISYDAALSALNSEGVSEALTKTLSASHSKTGGTSEEDSQSYSDQIQAQYNESANLLQSRNASFSQAERYEEAAAKVREHSANINQDFNQPFYEWLAGQRHDNGALIGVEGANNLFSSSEQKDINYLRTAAQQFVDEKIADDPNYLQTLGTNPQRLFDEASAGVNANDINQRFEAYNAEINTPKRDVGANNAALKGDVDAMTQQVGDGQDAGANAVDSSTAETEATVTAEQGKIWVRAK